MTDNKDITQPASCRIEAVEKPSASGRVAPFALYFPSGYQPSKAMKCKWEVHTSSTNAGEHYLIGRTSEVDLVGHTHDSVGGPLPCRYAVGVLNKATGTLKYIEVQSGRILRMEPRAKAINYAATGAGAVEEQQDREKLVQQNRRLVEAFGSTRRKRQLDTREGAAVQADAVGGAEAVKSLLQVVGDQAAAANATREVVMEEALSHRHIPPHHPEATVPHEAYKLQELCPRTAWDSIDTAHLKEAVTNTYFRQNELRAKGQVPPYVLDRLSIIRDVDSAVGQRNLKGFGYLAALLKLYDGSPSLTSSPQRGGIRGLSESKDIQIDVLQAALEQFYEAHELEEGATNYLRSDQKKSLMLLFILVIALILEGYTMDGLRSETLRQTLKLSAPQLGAMYRELGCVTKAASGSKGSPVKELTIMLLPPTSPPKTLAEYFPRIKVGSNKRSKR